MELGPRRTARLPCVLWSHPTPGPDGRAPAPRQGPDEKPRATALTPARRPRPRAKRHLDPKVSDAPPSRWGRQSAGRMARSPTRHPRVDVGWMLPRPFPSAARTRSSQPRWRSGRSAMPAAMPQEHRAAQPRVIVPSTRDRHRARRHSTGAPSGDTWPTQLRATRTGPAQRRRRRHLRLARAPPPAVGVARSSPAACRAGLNVGAASAGSGFPRRARSSSGERRAQFGSGVMP